MPTVPEAIAIQQELRHKVRIEPFGKTPKLIGGADISMNWHATESFGGIVVLGYGSLELKDHAVAKGEITFPYVPGLLSFREVPLLLEAWNKLKLKPDVLVVDGTGIAHPRRIGIASHLGATLDVPTIGCAKSVLTGVYEEPPMEVGAFTYLRDKKTDEILGAALRTKLRAGPVFISPGHLISLEESIEIMKHCMGKYRIPEPTRWAHNTVNEYRKKGHGTAW
ncbi:MAG TPA: deoxyribonuclease V [Candidatus Paceibacterota bacterium]|nr:deoxyribonuclease V [Candidatus Paceibacterota bacterium]